MEYIEKYIEENKERFLEELFGLIRIPSISSQAANKPTCTALPNIGKRFCSKPVPIALKCTNRTATR